MKVVVERFFKVRQAGEGEGRNPKAEGQTVATERQRGELKTEARESNARRDLVPDSDFGFRVSGFLRPSALGHRTSRSPGERGIALVITLIMLAVITFMAIAFLVLSRGERSSVGTATDQAIARQGADNALERAKIELIAPMIALTNANSSGLMVSTNLINPLGFQGGGANLSIYTSPTNVAYNYPSGQPLNLKDMLQNLTNLYINPRPPVFIVTNRLTSASDFRYYLDLNRNGAFEPTGWINVTNVSGQPILDAKGNRLVQYVQGDPQWIGGLEFPDRHHSADNRFLYRYCYLVVPTSQALDINYIHNAANRPNKGTIDRTGADFLRNQGVGTWEINLASFLYDLNTNAYAWGGPYSYRPVPPVFVNGNAFVDACSILTSRYGSINYPVALSSVRNLFANGQIAFANHSFDGYTAGPLMLGPSGFSYDPDITPAPRAVYPWPGADNTNHFFSTQDFFDPTKTSLNFAARLLATGTNVDTYDRYTFYNLVSQLGTDSAPEPPGKINLNYDNRVQPNVRGIVSATNFFLWKPVDFFTNTASMLLTNAGFTLSLTNLQVYPTNFYTPSVHRLLQLAANIYDATTNRALVVSPQYPYYPTVFRPIFRRIGTNVVIAGYREVINADMANARLAPAMVELDQTNVNVNVFPPYGTPFNPIDKNEPMVSGIPLIIGAKKGFPNFNEFAMQTQIFVSRLLEFKRPGTSTTAPPATNQMYVVAVTNSFGLEAWNSYLTNYPRRLELVTTANMTAIMTNQLGAANVLFNNRITRGAITNLAANSWTGWPITKGAGRSSMVLPFGMAQNFMFLSNSTYVVTQPNGGGGFVPITHEFNRTGIGGSFYVPRWWLNLNTRLLYVLVDVDANRIVDYVNINNWEQTVDINYQLVLGNSLIGNPADYHNPANAWLTNRLGGVAAQANVNVPTYGIMNQIQAGLQGLNPPDWNNFSQDPNSGLDTESAVDGFRYNLLGPTLGSPINPKDIGKTFYASNIFYAPFDPFRPIYIHTSWQANDPLVHYTAGDLMDLSVDPTNRINFSSLNPPLPNIGMVNTRFRPWGGNPGATDPLTDYQMAVKDPNVTRSDDWDFPTNKFPNIGWLGRVHRGTPWQTVYLKSTNALLIAGRVDTSLLNWTRWTGNPVTIAIPALTNMFSLTAVTNMASLAYVDRNTRLLTINDAILTSPTNDWHILDLFTTALNDNADRGQLSVNQTNLAAWSAVLSGVNVLSNSVSPNQPLFIQPAGPYNPAAPPPLVSIVNGINNARTNFPNHAFSRLGDILATPELTVLSPYWSLTNKFNDAVVERIPQQILGLLHGGEQPPRFVIYSYGQALKPAAHSLYQGGVGSGAFFGLCTNYQITAEVVTRAVVRVDGAPTKPRAVVESFNVLPPD